MRDANHAGEFSDPSFWDTEVIPTVADYYLDADAAWQRGDLGEVDPAWRIAFGADRVSGDSARTLPRLVHRGGPADRDTDIFAWRLLA